MFCRSSKNIKHLVVAGAAADDLGMQCGGWTIDWQGGRITRGGTTLLAAIRQAVSPRRKSLIPPMAANLTGADAIIVVVGEKPYAEMKGDRTNWTWPPADAALIEKAKATGVPVITVLVFRSSAGLGTRRWRKVMLLWRLGCREPKAKAWPMRCSVITSRRANCHVRGRGTIRNWTARYSPIPARRPCFRSDLDSLIKPGQTCRPPAPFLLMIKRTGRFFAGALWLAFGCAFAGRRYHDQFNVRDGAPPDGWRLAWSDEFNQPDGSAPDPANWSYDIGGNGWGNSELEYYTDRTNNACIEDGKLVIEAQREHFGGRNITSARLLTKGKWFWAWANSRRASKFPRPGHLAGVLWICGTNISSVGWPACGEIDIMENIGKEPGTVHGTVHGLDSGRDYNNGLGISGSLNCRMERRSRMIFMCLQWTANRPASPGCSTGNPYQRDSRIAPQKLPLGF